MCAVARKTLSWESWCYYVAFMTCSKTAVAYKLPKWCSKAGLTPCLDKNICVCMFLCMVLCCATFCHIGRFYTPEKRIAHQSCTKRELCSNSDRADSMLQYSKKTESFYLRVYCTPVSNVSPSTSTYEHTSYVLDHLNSFLAKHTVSIDNRNVYGPWSKPLTP